MSMLSDLLCVSLPVRSVETAKLWAIQRWPNWPVWGLLLTIFAYRYIHCNFAEISTGDFIANHWFIDQITLQMPGKIIDRLIWHILALSNIYKYIIFAAAVELHGGGGLQAGHQLRPLLGLLEQVRHWSMYHHILSYWFILWCDIFSGSWTSFSMSVPSSGSTSSITRNMSTTLALPKMRLHPCYHFSI